MSYLFTIHYLQYLTNVLNLFRVRIKKILDYWSVNRVRHMVKFCEIDIQSL